MIVVVQRKIFFHIFFPLALVLLLTYIFLSKAIPVADRSYYENRGEIIWETRTTEKVIALTFDDGPSPSFTPSVLEILGRYKARATFFVVGKQVAKFPDLARQIVLTGNEIENHSYSHPQVDRLSSTQIANEIKLADKEIFLATGARTMYFRPPMGFYDARVVKAAQENSHLIIMWSWSHDVNDWSNPGERVIAERVIRNIQPGHIILLHDLGGDRGQTLKALEIIIPRLAREGYRFITIKDLLSFYR